MAEELLLGDINRSDEFKRLVQRWIEVYPLVVTTSSVIVKVRICPIRQPIQPKPDGLAISANYPGCGCITASAGQGYEQQWDDKCTVDHKRLLFSKNH